MVSLEMVFRNHAYNAQRIVENELMTSLGHVEIGPLRKAVPMLEQQLRDILIPSQDLSPFGRILYAISPRLIEPNIRRHALSQFENQVMKGTVNVAVAVTAALGAGVYYNLEIDEPDENEGMLTGVLMHEMAHVGLRRYGQAQGYTLRAMKEISKDDAEGFAEIMALKLTPQLGFEYDLELDYLGLTESFVARTESLRTECTGTQVADEILSKLKGVIR